MRKSFVASTSARSMLAQEFKLDLLRTGCIGNHVLQLLDIVEGNEDVATEEVHMKDAGIRRHS
jgi:hypothetical protein